LIGLSLLFSANQDRFEMKVGKNGCFSRLQIQTDLI